jgi:hypothetical protein
MTTTGTITELKPLIMECIRQDDPVFLWGDTGLGKTDLMKQIAAEMGRKLITTMIAVMQPTDLMGLPVPDVKKEVAKWLRPDIMPRLDRDGEGGIWFLDEPNAAANATLTAFFQIVLDAKINGHELPKGWARVAAGNFAKQSNVAHALPKPLRNRFMHFELLPDVKAWAKHAAEIGIDPILIALLMLRPALLSLPPGSECEHVRCEQHENAFSTPRSIVRAAKYLTHPAEQRAKFVAASCGKGFASELEGLFRMMGQTPPIGDIISKPDSATLPSDPSAKYAVAAQLCSLVDEDNVAAVMTYAARLGRDFEMMLGITINASKAKSLKETTTFVEWGLRNAALLK